MHPRTYHAARQWLTIVAMIANGVDIGLVPESLARCGIRGVRFVALKDMDAVSPALMAWNPSHSSTGLEAFIDCAAGILKSRRA